MFTFYQKGSRQNSFKIDKPLGGVLGDAFKDYLYDTKNVRELSFFVRELSSLIFLMTINPEDYELSAPDTVADR